jgi:SpoIIAA-like
MIHSLQILPENVLAFVCRGQVTKSDYDTVLIPTILRALQKHRKVRLYYETAQDFTGFDADAGWEDFKFGMKHLSRWERVAVVTDVEWLTQTIRFFGFLIPGALKVFSLAEAAQARAWIIASH